MDLSLWPLFVFCWFSFLLLYFLICFVILNIEMLIFLEIIWEFRKFWVAAPWKSFELYYYFSFYISNTNVGLKMLMAGSFQCTLWFPLIQHEISLLLLQRLPALWAFSYAIPHTEWALGIICHPSNPCRRINCSPQVKKLPSHSRFLLLLSLTSRQIFYFCISLVTHF